jgi:hypothetical protein
VWRVTRWPFHGRITREQEDIDLFVWGKDAPRLMERLQHAGFEELGGPPPEAHRSVAKDGEELQIALLAINERGEIIVAGGPWAGPLQLSGMLVGPPGRLGDLVCPMVNPHVQVEIKEKFQEWRPDLPPVEKHQVDIARLRTALFSLSPPMPGPPFRSLVVRAHFCAEGTHQHPAT